MEATNTKLTGRQVSSIFLITMSLLMCSLPYLSNTFYEQFLEAFELTNTQAGILLTMYGLTATPGYLIGGVVADKFRAKRLVLIAIFGTSILAVIMTFVKGFTALMVIYACYGITIPVLHWSAYLKLICAQGTPEQKGRIFSLLEIFGAVANAIGSYGILAFLGIIIATVGFKWVTVIYAAILVLIGFFILFFVKEPESIAQDNSFRFSDISKVLKEPAVWLNCIIVMGLYMSLTGMTYLNPFMTQVFGVSSAVAVAIMAGAKSFLRFIGAPIGGKLIDKTGKSSSALIPACIIGIVLLAALLILPRGTQSAVPAAVLSLLFVTLITIGRPGLYTPVPEARIPMAITGTAMGLVSAVGYSTDIWLYSLCGSWIDRYGSQGYNYIFILFICGLLVAMAATICFDMYMKKRDQQLKETH